MDTIMNQLLGMWRMKRGGSNDLNYPNYPNLLNNGKDTNNPNDIKYLTDQTIPKTIIIDSLLMVDQFANVDVVGTDMELDRGFVGFYKYISFTTL